MTDKLQYLREINAALASYQDFRECIIEKFETDHFGATVKFALDHIWQSEGVLRPDLNEKKIVRLEFGLVQELHLDGDLNYSMVQEPHKINWGLSEIALITVDDTHYRLARYSTWPARFYHAEFLWEGARHIGLIFSGLTIAED